MKGGFIIDDWGIVATAHNSNGLLSTIKSSFPVFSNRPLAPIFISLTGTIFGLNPTGYIITTLFLWLTALILIGYTLKYYLNKNFFLLFIAAASTPIIASTVIFSPGMQITATISYFLYGLALYYLHRFLLSSEKKYYILTYLFILTALLTYEIILPLLVILLFLPYIKDNNIPIKNYFIKYGLPLIFVLLIILLYQKVIMPNFMPVYSRFNPATDPIMIIAISVKWMYATFFAPFVLGLRVLFATYKHTLPFSSFIIILISWIVFIFSIIKTNVEVKNKKYILLTFLLTLLANYILLLLANASPNTTGYDNRGLSSTWITLSLILAYLGSTYKNKILLSFVFIMIGLSWLVFIAERNSYIDSYQSQIITIEDIAKKIQQAKIQTGATVLSNLPQSLPNAFNQEDFFNNPWDFGNALNLYSGGNIAGGNTLTNKKISLNSVNIEEKQMTIDGYWSSDYKNLWFYIYNPNIASSSLQKISGQNDINKIILEINVIDNKKQTWYNLIYSCLKSRKEDRNIAIKAVLSCFYTNPNK